MTWKTEYSGCDDTVDNTCYQYCTWYDVHGTYACIPGYCLYWALFRY